MQIWVLVTLESIGKNSPYDLETVLQDLLFLYKYVSKNPAALVGTLLLRCLEEASMLHMPHNTLKVRVVFGKMGDTYR